MFKLVDLYAQLSVKGLPSVDTALAGVRRQMIQTQRIAKALGGELGQGMGLSSELFRRATQQRLEPSLLRMQANLLAATGKMRGWSQSQGMAVATAIGFSNGLSKVSFHVEEITRHLEGMTSVAKLAFASLSGLIVGSTAAASPELFATLGNSFAWLAGEIGRGFVPYAIEVARKVQDMARWFRDLSPETKDAIARFALLAAGLAGTVVAVGLIGGAVLKFIAVMQGLVALTTLYLGRSAAVVAAHEAEAVAANVAATAETRLATARAGAAGIGAGAAAGGAAAGGAGSTFLAFGKGLAKVFAIVTAIEAAAGGIGGAISPEVQRPGAGKGMTTSDNIFRGAIRAVIGDSLTAAIDKKLGYKPMAAGGGSSDQGQFLASNLRPVWMGGVADAWRQAQMAATSNLGPEGEKLKLNRDIYGKLVEATGYLSQMAPQDVGPN